MSIRILLVEDDKYFNKLLYDRLSLEGFQIHSVLDGESAWQALETARELNEPFELMICDMLLPRLMGAELFTRIRETENYTKLRLLAISGIYKDPLQIKEIASLHGLVGYWTKPFDLQKFVDFLKALPADESQTQNPAEDTAASTAEEASGLNDAEGSLGDRPPELLLLDGYDHAFTGKLTLDQENFSRRIYFQNGFPVSADSSAISESLGNSLVALKLIDRETQEKASALMVSEGVQFGQMLLKMEALTNDQLFQGIRKHIYRILVQAICMRKGRYQFESLKELPSYILPLEFNSILLMTRAFKALYSDEFIEQLYVGRKDFYPHLQMKGKQILPLFNLDESSLKFLTAIDGQKRLHEIHARLPEEAIPVLNRVFYILEALNLLEWKAERSTLSDSAARVANFEEQFQMDAQASDGLESQLKDLQSEYMAMLGKNYFEIFELAEEKEISYDELESSYRSLRFRLHPDRIAEQGSSGQMQRILDDMLARIDKAYQVLSSERTRHEYLKQLQSQRQDSAADSKRYLKAQELFREGHRLLSNQDYDNASKRFYEAYQTWKRGFEYELYGVYCEFRSAIMKKNENESQKTFNRLKDLAQQNRSHDLGFLFLGHANVALGKIDQAREAYQMALKNNENNDEAAIALAKLADQDIKRDRLNKVVRKSATRLKASLIWIGILGLSMGLYFFKDQLLKTVDASVETIEIEPYQHILPVTSIRYKQAVAKVVTREGKLGEMPEAVLKSKCLQLLERFKQYGILELYLFDEKSGMKGRCRGETLQRYK